MNFRPLLWEVMEAAAGSPDKFKRLCEGADREQLILLYRRFGIAAGKIIEKLRPNAQVEQSSRWRNACWAVTKGKDAWFDALESPGVIIGDALRDMPDFPRIMENVYRSRFAGEIPEQEPSPSEDQLEVTPEWEERAWEIIELADVGVPLSDAVAPYTRSELVKLGRAIEHITEGANDSVTKQCGEDPDGLNWWALKEWLISQGREVFADYMAHPGRIPRDPPEDAPRAISHRLDEIYHARYGTLPPPTPRV